MIQPPGKQGFSWRYHQYTLLARKVGENGEEQWEEDVASPILFHVQPPDSKPATKLAPVLGAQSDLVDVPGPLSDYGAYALGAARTHARTFRQI